MTVTGKDLMALGFEQGADLGRAIDAVNALGLSGPALAEWVARNKPSPRAGLQEAPAYRFNLEAEDEAGDWERDAPWRKKAQARHAARTIAG